VSRYAAPLNRSSACFTCQSRDGEGNVTCTAGGVAPILVVDDDASTLDLVRTLLQLQGYAVLTASSGHEALEIASSCRPSLVVTDLMMPGMDGCSLCAHLRDDLHWLGPLIMVTAAPRTVPKSCPTALMAKPIDVAAFLQLIRTHAAAS